MQVVVWQLRRNGVKLGKDSLDGPHRGWLRMDLANIAGHSSLHVSLHASTSWGAPMVIQSMTDAAVRKIDERGMLIYGRQAAPMAGPTAARWPQAWFCQPVGG